MIWLSVTVAALVLLVTVGALLLRRFKKTGITLMVLGLLLTAFFITGTAICWSAPETQESDPGYGLLLGCGLENGQAKPELVARCQGALQWMQEHPKTMLIVSGGDPGHQGVTEAAVMAAWLRNHGANPDWILMEDQSTDTRENILFSQDLAREEGLKTENVTIITSSYHQTRAHFLAQRAGQEAACRSVPVPVLPHLIASVREVYCMISEVLGL